MSVFMDSFRRELGLRSRERQVGKVRKIAERKLAAGEPTDKVAAFVGSLLGCPCCGPEWWRDLAIRSYTEKGEALPPELAEVSN